MNYGKRNKSRRKRKSTKSTGTATQSAGTSESPQTAERSTGRMTPWWVRESDRYKDELARLDEADINYAVDEAAKARGVLAIDLTTQTEEVGELRLRAIFPDRYPYFRFEIQAPDLQLPHHQHPFGKQLCVLGRATRNWNTTDTLADFVVERVPAVLRTGKSSGSTSAQPFEEHQGEPFSDYYTYGDRSMLLIDGSWNIPSLEHGRLIVSLSLHERKNANIFGVVVAVEDDELRRLAVADARLTSLFTEQHDFRWIRLNEPIKESDPNEFLKHLVQISASLAKPAWRIFKGIRYDIVGCVFPEEQRYQQLGSGWVFLVRAIPIGGSGHGIQTFFVKAGRSGTADLSERIPELGRLSNQKIAVFGVGGLGGPSTLKFARCGVGELRLLDHDYVDPATAVRWPLGVPAAGLSKVDGLSDFISSNYPYVNVVPYCYRLGMCPEPSENPSDSEVLESMLDGIDLIYDCTAELGINHLLSDLAAERGINYICLSVTKGGWGGRILRIRPGVTRGCWMCHQWAIQTGQIPIPAASPHGEVQPVGCADPTFTGASFDLCEVAMAGVRLASSTLTANGANGYPEADWDVAVINFRDETGALTVPQWQFFQIERHPECKNVKAHGEKGMVLAKDCAATAG